MLPLATLRAAVRDALAYISAQPDVAEAEVFASANGNLTVRLNYTSHIPCNGVEEPKSLESYGLGLRIAFRTPQGIKLGFGSEPTDLSLAGAQRALDKARSGAVLDPQFVSLPHPPVTLPTVKETQEKYHDPPLMRVSNTRLVETGWRCVERALETFQSSEDLLNHAGSPEKVNDLGLILGGDVILLQERMAIASTHLPKALSDESTLVMSFATAMVEEQFAKGSGWSVSSHLTDFNGDSAAEAARNAIASMGGQRMPSGSYRVILGPQPLTEILEWVLMPSLQLDMFYAGASAFLGKLGQGVASDQLYLYDDGATPGLAASKAITDEGLPTGRTDLIKEGVLSGLLANDYEHQRIRHDPQGREKLGVDPAAALDAIAPRNGFRSGNGGGRDFGKPPGVTPTNLVIEGRNPLSRPELFQLVGDGIYIGRIWYTYPVNGITSADFSGTIVGDSYLIKDGKLAAPIKPNSLRMNDNALRLVNNILGIGAERRGTVRWSSDQVTWAPELAVADFHLEEISEHIEGVY